MSEITLKRIKKEINLYSKQNFEFDNFVLAFNEDNIREWFFIIHSLKDSRYKHGIYLGTIILDPEYPFKPPTIKMITPNGRFMVEGDICTSFTRYHKESYSSAWRVNTMIEAFISFMLDDKDAVHIGSLKTSDKEKKEMAKESINFNKNNKIYQKYFKDFLNEKN